MSMAKNKEKIVEKVKAFGAGSSDEEEEVSMVWHLFYFFIM